MLDIVYCTALYMYGTPSLQGYEQVYRLQLIQTRNKLVMKTDRHIYLFFFMHLYKNTHVEIHTTMEKDLQMHAKTHCLYYCLSERVHYAILNEHVCIYKIIYFIYTVSSVNL